MFKNELNLKILLQLLLGIALVLGFVVALPLALIYYVTDYLPIIWLVTMLIFLCLLAVFGQFTAHKSLLGLLINKENRLSFARLQMVCWWVLLISAVLVVAEARYKAQATYWLTIDIPEGLLAAAGLSMGTAAVTSIIDGIKRNPSTSQNLQLEEEREKLKGQWDQENQAAGASKQTEGHHLKLEYLSQQLKVYEERNGFLKVSEAPAFTDFILGNEVGNWEEIDWAKVQAILLTAILVGLYSLALWHMLVTPDKWLTNESGAFPAFSGALATLLAISCASYKSNQLANHSLVTSAILAPSTNIHRVAEKLG